MGKEETSWYVDSKYRPLHTYPHANCCSNDYLVTGTRRFSRYTTLLAYRTEQMVTELMVFFLNEELKFTSNQKHTLHYVKFPLKIIR